jgi:hypothetical protein
MVQQQPDTKSGGSSGHPGVVDPTNLGIDLGSTLEHYVAQMMMVGGTLELPYAGVDAGEVDLSAAELSGGTLELPISGRSRSGAPTYQQPRCKEVTVLSRTTRRRCTTSSK